MMSQDSERQRLTILLQKAYFGQLSSEEARILSDWRNRSAENEDLYRRMMNGETMSELVEWRDRFDPERVDRAIRKRVRIIRQRRRKMHYFRIAAAVFLLLGTGGIWYTIRQHTNHQQVETAVLQIQPGRTKAILTLGNGRQVALNQQPVELKIDKHRLVTGDSASLDYSLPLSARIDPKEADALPQQNRVDVPAGGEYRIVLADGTKVWINAESSLSFPVEFAGDRRKVVLQGEAYFEVSPDARKPFIVTTPDGMEIQVLGTSFNVEAYSDREEWKTTLAEGRVEVGMAGRQVVLQPRQQLNYNRKTRQGIVEEVNLREVIAWKNGWFVFDNTPLEEILETMRRWYDIAIEYRDPQIRQLRFTGDLSKYDSFEAVVRMFEDTRKIKLEVRENRLIVGKR